MKNVYVNTAGIRERERSERERDQREREIRERERDQRERVMEKGANSVLLN